MTREKKFTPGPWRWQESQDEYGCIVIGTDKSYNVATAYIGCYTTDGADKWEANAHLIAAAPDLFEIAIAAEKYLNDVVGGNETKAQSNGLRDLINTALAKAYGDDK